ncbi:hypothetical protein [Rhodococcus kyotonensis]|uniref:Uncharacterized protein n=1 Tax=Rhodococcoides kyotonense TaxID=398843 RepID=A0A239FC92_9NOCA|nr:hypothetical protein [Rhodococcus kyotonensis]SNS54351.1 hypothetical protein SAMN05421642_103219 [Rhodococcus kyotonensis]
MPDDVHLVSLAVGTVATAADAARRTTRALARVPLIGGSLRTLSARGERTVVAATTVADALLRALVVKVVAAALEEIDLTRLIRENVDIDAIIEGVDLDKAVAQVDLDQAVARVDLDKAVARVDLDAAVARVDLDRAIARVDLDAVVDTVDLDRQVSRVDLDGAVARVDLIALANFVIDGVDLPEIIRESTGSLSAEAVRGVRSHGMQADDAVSHFVGKLFGREQRTESGPTPQATT